MPRLGELSIERAMAPADAFFADAEIVAYEACAGRVAAEMIVPAPPGIPRVLPGQRIDAPLRDWLVATRDAGMFVLDPADPAERRIRVVREADCGSAELNRAAPARSPARPPS